MRTRSIKKDLPLISEMNYERRKVRVNLVLEYKVGGTPIEGADDMNAVVEMAINPDYNGIRGLRLVNVEVESITREE